MNRYSFMGHEYYRMPIIYYLGYYEWVRKPDDKSKGIPKEMMYAMNLHAKDVGANVWQASPSRSTNDYWFVEFHYDAREGDLRYE